MTTFPAPPPVLIRTSRSDRLFLQSLTRFGAVWAGTVAALVPAMSWQFRIQDAPWIALVGLVPLAVMVGGSLGFLCAGPLDEFVKPQTAAASTASVAAACWGWAATGPWWPVLAALAVAGTAAATTFWFWARSYRDRLGAADWVGGATYTAAYLWAAGGVVCGLVVTLFDGATALFGAAAIVMALLTFAAVLLPGFRYDPLASEHQAI